MSNPSPQYRTMPAEQGTSSWWWLAGLVLGLLCLTLDQLPTKWFLTIFGGLIGLSVTLAVPDRKKLFLSLMVLALPLAMSKTFWFTSTPVFRSSYGCTIYLAYIPLLGLYMVWAFRRANWEASLILSKRGLLSFAGLFATALLSGMLANRRFAAFDLFTLAFSGLLFIYVASDLRERGELRLVVGLLIITGIIQALIAIGQNLTGSSLGLEFFGARKFVTGRLGLETLTRVTGTLGHPGGLGEFFALTIPLSFSLLFYPMYKPMKVLLFMVVMIEFAGLGMSYLRSAIFWTIIASGAIMVFHLSRRLGLTRAIITSMTIGALLIVLLMVVPNPIQKGLFRTEYETAYGRVPLMQVAVEMIRHHPFLGVGLNNYVPVAKQYDYTPEQLTTVWNSAVHNVYLFVAGETGLIGLFFLLCFLTTIIWHLLAVVRTTDPYMVCVGLGVLGGLLAYLATWLSDFSSWTSARTFWFMLGLAVAVTRLAKATPEADSCLAG